MKIERINENQIRCTLTNFELNMRNLNLSELAYGSDKARTLFREMIQRASNEVGFDTEDFPIMVEAIPMANESVVLIVTKVEDPEELDTRFSRFSSFDEDEDGWGALTSSLLEGADSLFRLLGGTQADAAGTPGNGAENGTPEGTAPADKPNPAQFMRLFQFPSIDTVCAAARGIGSAFTGESILYKNPASGGYLLFVDKQEADEINFSRTCNILSEYGTRLRCDAAAAAYCAEHYEKIVKEHALAALAKL